MKRIGPKITLLALCGLSLVLVQMRSTAQEPAGPRAVFDKYCITCHSEKTKTAGVDLQTLDTAKLTSNSELVEKVIAKLRAGSMPPPGSPRPDVETYHRISVMLEQEMDRAAAARPNPGRIGAVHRLNRAEYNNAIRDLLAID